MEPFNIVITAAVLVVMFFVIITFIKLFIVICPPNQVLVFSGRKHAGRGGKQTVKTVFGGRAFRVPLIERVDSLDLRVMDVHLNLKNAYAKGGVPLNCEAIANIKITDDERYIGNAIERFLDINPKEIQAMGKDTLEGHLRGVIAKLTPEQCNEDRLTLMKELQDEAEEDLRQLGLHLDTFNIHQISDETGYLEAIGREKIAIVQREVDVAKSDADRAAKEEEAKWAGLAAVARERAEAEIAEKRNELRKVKAELEADAKSKEETAAAKAREARALAEKELQEVRAILEKLRLQADIVEPAEAKKQAQVYRARGTMAPQAEKSRALAESLQSLAEVWQQAGNDAKTIFVLERIEGLLKNIVQRLNIQVLEANLVDDGSGTALPQFVGSHIASVQAVLDQLRDMTGLDLKAAMNRPGLSERNGGS